jgi:outer membrane protein OmpA-like peptidoglycan-associated protein
MREVSFIGIALAGLVPLLVGCATRDWARDLVEKRVVSVESLVAEQGQRVTGLEGRVEEEGQRVKALEASVTSTSESARAASESAREARARADEVNSRLTRLWVNRHRRNLAEAQDVYFGFDQAELDDTAQTALTSLVKELRGNPRLGIELQGYADPKGTVRYNIALSQRRVEAVRRYLIEQGIEMPRIQSIGLGPIMDTAVEDAKKRRVTVRVMVEPD